MNKNLWLKIKESISSVLPISVVVLILHLTIAPLPLGTLILFAVGTPLLILGMGLFTLGADLSMMMMGERVGAQLTKSRRLTFLICIAFIMGVMITIAEPDLQVLAQQVPSVPNMTLILAVAFGVGVFLVLALLRILFQVSLSLMLVGLYLAVFAIAAFTSPDFLAVAFDSGGVTTGPITVPFILALGLGVAAVRGDAGSHDDSFGLISLCSIGPVLTVLILGMFFNAEGGAASSSAPAAVENAGDIFRLFAESLPHYAKEVLIALLPIVLFFLVFQLAALHLPKIQMIKISVGLVYTYIGLVLFLTGVNVGFMPVGNLLGAKISQLSYNWVIIPIAMLIGFFVVAAEPAVHVLNKQVEEVTGGAISRNSMMAALSIGIACSLGLAMVRVMTGVSIWYFLLGGYAIALGLSFVVPKIFTAIAFDSGGVASGPMTATFLLPFAMGACEALGGNMLRDAFGIVAMVAMTPLVTIQSLGAVFKLKTILAAPVAMADEELEIIEL